MPRIGYVVLAHYIGEFFKGKSYCCASKDTLIEWAKTQPFWSKVLDNPNPEETVELAFQVLTSKDHYSMGTPQLEHCGNGTYVCPFYIEEYKKQEEKRIDSYVSTIVNYALNEAKKREECVRISRDGYSLYHCQSDEMLREKLSQSLPPNYRVLFIQDPRAVPCVEIRWS